LAPHTYVKLRSPKMNVKNNNLIIIKKLLFIIKKQS